MACAYGRHGYRRITAVLRAEGWCVTHKQAERIWPGDGSCIRLRPTHRNHVWSYDFVMDRTADGRVICMLTIVDKFTHECLAIDVARKLASEDALDQPSDTYDCIAIPIMPTTMPDQHATVSFDCLD
jgi:putative transposase